MDHLRNELNREAKASLFFLSKEDKEMLGYEAEFFDEYNNEYEDLHNDAYINDYKNEMLEIEIQNIMEEYCK